VAEHVRQLRAISSMGSRIEFSKQGSWRTSNRGAPLERSPFELRWSCGTERVLIAGPKARRAVTAGD